jgi:hypothetical protein
VYIYTYIERTFFRQFGREAKNMEKSIEKKLEKDLREGVKKLGGIALKFWCISFTGFPDRMVLMPGGRIWFVEVKDRKKEPSERQKSVHRLLRRLGFEVWTIKNEDLLQGFLYWIQL